MDRAPLDSSDYNDFPHLLDPHSDPDSDPNGFSDETDESGLLTLSDSLSDPVNTPMPNTNPATETEKTLTPGVTAASVMAGLLRSIKMGYDKCLTQAEAKLIEHFIATAQKEFPIFSINGTLMRTVSALPLAWQSRFFNTAVLPAYDHYLLARKLMVRRIMEEKIRDGVTNVVTLGAGFETASLFASADFPDVMFYDIEQDPTYSTKVKALDTIPQEVIESGELGSGAITAVNVESDSYKINGNFRLIRADLSKESIDELLLRHGFDRSKKTLVVVEAVLMYLEENDVEALFDDLHDLNESQEDDILYVYASFMDRFKLSALSTSTQGRSNELIKSILPPEKVLKFMNACGVKVEGQFEPVTQLDRVRDMEYFEYYKKDTTQPREQFYLMSLSSERNPNGDKNISDIPVLQLEIDPALLPPVPETKPGCKVM